MAYSENSALATSIGSFLLGTSAIEIEVSHETLLDAIDSFLTFFRGSDLLSLVYLTDFTVFVT